MNESKTPIETSPTAEYRPIHPAFEEVIDQFCLEQAELRARLARLVWAEIKPANAPSGTQRGNP